MSELIELYNERMKIMNNAIIRVGDIYSYKSFVNGSIRELKVINSSIMFNKFLIEFICNDNSEGCADIMNIKRDFNKISNGRGKILYELIKKEDLS